LQRRGALPTEDQREHLGVFVSRESVDIPHKIFSVGNLTPVSFIVKFSNPQARHWHHSSSLEQGAPFQGLGFASIHIFLHANPVYISYPAYLIDGVSIFAQAVSPCQVPMNHAAVRLVTKVLILSRHYSCCRQGFALSLLSNFHRIVWKINYALIIRNRTL
jgi:hypothetical protein